MDKAFIITVVAVLFVVGSLIALAWWRLARRIAPYDDELAAKSRPPASDPHEVIVIDQDAPTKPRS